MCNDDKPWRDGCACNPPRDAEYYRRVAMQTAAALEAIANPTLTLQ